MFTKAFKNEHQWVVSYELHCWPLDSLICLVLFSYISHFRNIWRLAVVIVFTFIPSLLSCVCVWSYNCWLQHTLGISLRPLQSFWQLFFSEWFGLSRRMSVFQGETCSASQYSSSLRSSVADWWVWSVCLDSHRSLHSSVRQTIRLFCLMHWWVHRKSNFVFI